VLANPRRARRTRTCRGTLAQLALVSALTALVHGCSLDPRGKLQVREQASARDAAVSGMDAGESFHDVPRGPAPDQPGGHSGGNVPPLGPGAGETGGKPDEPPPVGPPPPDPPDCCTLPVDEGGCAEVDLACAPAGNARIEHVRAMLRVVLRSPAFAECLNRTMRKGSDNTLTWADSSATLTCDGERHPYALNGYGPYVSCMPDPDRSHGDPAWDELVDRQLARALNALQLDVNLFPIAAEGAGVSPAGYDPAGGVSYVSYPGPAPELAFDEAVGNADDGRGFVPDVVRASLRNLGYDHGCHPEQAPADSDHGNCGRDPGTWHPDRALDNIAAFCAKEVLLRSADDANEGCGTEGSGAQQTLRPCELNGLMVIAQYGVQLVDTSCQCVPDPAAFGASAPGDRFGAAVAAADFDGDGFHDLAVGAPARQFPGTAGGGGVFLYRGARLGLFPWRSVSAAELGFDQEGAACGASLAVGNFANDASAELVIGCPGADSGAGGVAIVPFCPMPCGPRFGGPQLQLTQRLHPTAPGEFGFAFAVGKFAGEDAHDDLLVGAPSATGMGPMTGRVEKYQGIPTGALVEPAGALEGTMPYDRYGAALAIGDVQATPGLELLVGAPGTKDAQHGCGAVYVASAAGVRQLVPPSCVEDAGFGSAIAVGDLVGDDYDDVVIAAPGSARLYRVVGAGEQPGAPQVVASYAAAAPATAVAVVPARDASWQNLVLVGQPGAGAATLYRPSGSELVVEERLGQRDAPFWSAAHDLRDGGHCASRADGDAACAIDAVMLAGKTLGTAVAVGLFGLMGEQLVLGAPDDGGGGAVYVRAGSRGLDLANVGTTGDAVVIDALEYRLDPRTSFYSGTPYIRRFGPATKWSDYACEEGEVCLPRPAAEGTGLAVFSRDLAGKEGNAWVLTTTRASFREPLRWHEQFCPAGALCTVGDVDAGSDADLIAFVRDSIAGHEHHVHVLRCAGCALEEWHDNFCHVGNVCLVGSMGPSTVRSDGDDLIEIEPGLGISIGYADIHNRTFVVESVPGGKLCADGHTCVVGDVDGDLVSDVVEFYQGPTGEVHVALGSREGFAPARRWHASFCTAGEQCRVGDVNGDGLADIVSFVREATPGKEGNVWVSLSNRVDFGRAERWHHDLCRGEQLCQLGDVNADLRSDAIVFSGPAPGAAAFDVNVALSLPAGFRL
jgi:hypothetical protein